MMASRYSVVRALPGRPVLLGKHVGREINQGLLIKDHLKDTETVVMKVTNDTFEASALIDYRRHAKVSERSWTLVGDSYVVDCNTRHGNLQTCVCPLPMGQTQHHLTYNKLDNRSANIKAIPEVAETRKSTVLVEALPQEVRDLLDRHTVPKYVYYDSSLMRYSFEGHPYIAQLERANLRVRQYGTGSRSRSLVEKFVDMLAKYQTMCDLYRATFPDVAAMEDGDVIVRKELAKECFDMMQLAHQHCADFPPPPPLRLDQLESELHKAEQLQRALATAHRIDVEAVSGPVRIDISEVHVQGLDATWRIKGAGKTLIDTKLDPQLSQINWECSENLRLLITAAMRAQYPCLESAPDRMSLPEFIFRVFVGREVPQGMAVAAINYMRCDVRTANLELIVDNGRGQKSRSLRVDAAVMGDLGMEFLPRGLAVSKDGAGYFFHTKVGSGKRKQFGFRSAEQAVAVFNRDVVPYMRAAVPDFDAANTVYQRLCKEYEIALEAIE